MTDAERELLVERYVAFEMSADEEQEFILRAATDAALFGMLRSYRLMDRALAHNRSTLPQPPSVVGERAMSALASTPAVASAPGRARGAGATLGAGALLCIVAGFLLRGAIPLDLATPSPAAVVSDSVESALPLREMPALDRSPREVRAAEPATALRARRAPDVTTTSSTRRGAGAAATRREPLPGAERERSATTPIGPPPAPMMPARDDARAPETAPIPTERTRADSITFRAKIIPPQNRTPQSQR
jgi:hypothetical protein